MLIILSCDRDTKNLSNLPPDAVHYCVVCVCVCVPQENVASCSRFLYKQHVCS